MSITHPVGPINLLRVVYNKPALTKPSRRTLTIRTLLANTTPDTSTQCLVWRGSTNPINGYATLSMEGRQYYVHRVVAFYTQVRHPQWRRFLMGQRYIFVCHTCDNPPCINPFHLVIATGQYNVWDSQAKGRRPLKDRADSTLQLGLYNELLGPPTLEPLNLDVAIYSKPVASKTGRDYKVSDGKPKNNRTRLQRMLNLFGEDYVSNHLDIKF